MSVCVCACRRLSNHVCPAALAGCHFTLAAQRRGINHSLCAYNEPHMYAAAHRNNKNTQKSQVQTPISIISPLPMMNKSKAQHQVAIKTKLNSPKRWRLNI